MRRRQEERFLKGHHRGSEGRGSGQAGDAGRPEPFHLPGSERTAGDREEEKDTDIAAQEERAGLEPFKIYPPHLLGLGNFRGVGVHLPSFYMESSGKPLVVPLGLHLGGQKDS